MPLPDTGGLTTAQRNQVDQVYAAMLARGDTQLATDWVTFANSHWPAVPAATLAQMEQAFLSFELGHGVAAGIAKVGGLLGQVPASVALNEPGIVNLSNNPLVKAGAAAEGAGQQAWNAATAVPRFLSMLANPNLWLRVGEVVSGLILLGIGVNALFKGAPMKVVTKGAALAAKVVPK